MDTRLAGAITFALVASALLGCNAPSLVGPIYAIDARSQECVDGALQRHPDPAILADAVVRFDLGCRAGDPAACSLLGLMHDQGLAVPQNTAKAVALYARACNAGNRLGCAHLNQANTALLPAFGTPMPPAASAKR